MAPTEFSIIRDYFADLDLGSSHVNQGVGDDCALLNAPAAGFQLVLSTDALIGAVHFPENAAGSAVARRALAVNLSDISAMGAEPLAFLLSLTLPAVNTEWLADFAHGLGQQALKYKTPLVGGDTTRGPLSISISIVGQVPRGEALLRSGASAGDAIYVSGALGDAAAALQLVRNSDPACADADHFMQHFYDPPIDFRLSSALRGKATAAIDVSDGLLADLGHILTASKVGAVLNVDAVPRSVELFRYAGEQRSLQWALSGGDDYRLCFTMPPALAGSLYEQDFKFNQIGEIVEGHSLRCHTAAGADYLPDSSGYKHF